MSTQHTFSLIPLAMLETGRNIRKTKPSDPEHDALVQSIKNHGLLENLIVQHIDNKDGKYRIVAGYRRFSALKALLKQGDLSDQHPIPCLTIDSSADPKELALAENTVRAAMHPADQVLVFKALVADKRNTAVEIADRFGLSERTVNQRLRMATVHTDILNAYRRNEIPQDAVIAFTLTKDKNEQKAVFESLTKQSSHITGGWVRSTLTREKINAGNRLVKFIGLKAYINAGGDTSTDLFADPDSPEALWINNPDLVEQLALQKLNTLAEKQDPRWSWTDTVLHHDYESQSRFKQVDPTPRELTPDEIKLYEQLENVEDKLQDDLPEADYDKLLKTFNTLSDKISKIDQSLYKNATFTPEQYANAGCMVSIDYRGKPDIFPGLVKKEDWKNLTKDAKQAEKATRAERGDTPSEPEPLSYSQSLADDLSYLRNTIIKTHLVNHPDLALDLITYQLAHALDLASPYRSKALSITANPTDNKPVTPPDNDMHERNNPCIAAFADHTRSLNLTFLDEKDEYAAFAQFQTLDKEAKTLILATVVSASLHRQLSAGHEKHLRCSTELAVAQMAINWRKHMPLTSDFFFNRLPKQAIYDIGDGLFGAELWSKRYGSQRKRDLADMLARHCDPDQPSPEITPELKTKAAAWTPIGFNPVPYKPKTPKAQPATKPTSTTPDATNAETTSPSTAADNPKGNGHSPAPPNNNADIPAFLNNID